jgi:quercetin dioxygenase-like cupin family protein
MSDNLHHWDEMEWVTIIPGYRAKFIHSKNMTFGLWDIDAGAPLPEHSHPHEQVTHLLEGKFEITIDGNTQVMHAGMVAIIPSNAKHSGKAINSCRILDAFYPVREDFRGSSKGGS